MPIVIPPSNTFLVAASTSPAAHLVFLRSGVLLLKRPGSNWREFQWEFDDFLTSLGPWTAEEIVDHFEWDYKSEERWPFSRDQLASFFASDAEIVSAV